MISITTDVKQSLINNISDSESNNKYMEITIEPEINNNYNNMINNKILKTNRVVNIDKNIWRNNTIINNVNKNNVNKNNVKSNINTVHFEFKSETLLNNDININNTNILDSSELEESNICFNEFI
jgi:hypothetical protein